MARGAGLAGRCRPRPLRRVGRDGSGRHRPRPGLHRHRPRLPQRRAGRAAHRAAAAPGGAPRGVEGGGGMSGDRSNEPLTDLALGVLAAGTVTVGVLWAAGALSARLSGHRVPHGHPHGELAAFAHLGNPSAGWHAPVGPPLLYWTLTAAALVSASALGWLIWR